MLALLDKDVLTLSEAFWVSCIAVALIVLPCGVCCGMRFCGLASRAKRSWRWSTSTTNWRLKSRTSTLRSPAWFFARECQAVKSSRNRPLSSISGTGTGGRVMGGGMVTPQA